MHSPLRAARKKRDMTIKQVALASGVDHGNLSRIERGLCSASKETAEKLAAFFAGEITEIHILYPERFTQKK